MPKIEIYATLLCPYCHRAKRLLKQKGVAFHEIDVLTAPTRREEMVARAGGRRTVPQIFVDGRHIGGCDELYALESDGQLDRLLRGEAA